MTTPEFVFSEYDATYGQELWVTDGTASGTHLLKDIVPGATGSNPLNFFNLANGDAVFTITDASGGAELWVTTGTTVSTTALATLNPATSNYPASDFLTLGSNGQTIFQASPSTSSTGTELWVTNGTSTGTHVLSDSSLSGGSFNQAPYDVKEIAALGAGGTSALFVGSYSNGGTSYSQLFVTDGTNSGTHIINPGYTPGVTPVKIQSLTAGKTEDFFLAQTYQQTNTVAYELWVSDGTTAGTHAVTNYATLTPPASGLTPKLLDPFKSGVLFAANDHTHGYQLWYSDGTASGTRMVSYNAYNKTAAQLPGYFTQFTDKSGHTLALFDASSSSYTNRYDVFVTDGTTSGTTELTNLRFSSGTSQNSGSGPGNFTVLGNRVVFEAQGSSYSSNPAYKTGEELWVTDGTVSGTYLLKDIYPGAVGSYPSNFEVFGNEILFTVKPTYGATPVLWETDGTKSGTHVFPAALQFPASSFTGTSIGPTPCYVRGTQVRTPLGEVAVEDLAVGDLLATLGGTSKPIRWIGRRLVTAGNEIRDRTSLPVRIAKDALGYGVPHRDLLVSPDHAIYLDGVLVPAQFLVNGRNITRCLDMETVEYFHIELSGHDIILAEGAAAETYLDTGNRAMFENAILVPTDAAALGGTAAEVEALANRCAPFVDSGPRLHAIRWAINIRAETKGFRTTRDPDLHLVADSVTVYAETITDGRYRFRLDARPGRLSIRSRAEIPACCSGSSDWRLLGVAISRIILSDETVSTEIGSAAVCLAEGFSSLEPGFRWTDGDADIPAALCIPFANSFYVEIEVVDTLDYPLPTPGSTSQPVSEPSADVPRLADFVEANLSWAQSAEGTATVH